MLGGEYKIFLSLVTKLATFAISDEYKIQTWRTDAEEVLIVKYYCPTKCLNVYRSEGPSLLSVMFS